MPAPSASNQRRSLVTGGGGFIGSHLVGHLIERGDAVTVVDNFTTGRRENLTADDRLRVVEADLNDVTDEIGHDRELGCFDEIYHLAAAVGVELVLNDPVSAIETNVGLTTKVVRAAMGAGPDGEPARLLFASSSEVYGKGVHDVFSENDDVLYGPTSVTRWSYALSKALDEHVVLASHASDGLPAVVARFFNTVGPRQTGTYGMVLPRFVESALDGHSLKVFGDGEQSRCFCDVRDVVPALPALLECKPASGLAVNLGSEQAISIQGLAELVLQVTGSGSTIERVPYSEAYPSGFEDLRRRRPDLARARSLIGFTPSISLAQTISDIKDDILASRGRTVVAR